MPPPWRSATARRRRDVAGHRRRRPRHSFPDAEVVDLDGGSSRRHSSTATCTSPPPGWRSSGSTCATPPRSSDALRLVAEYARRHPDGPDLGARLGRIALAGRAPRRPPPNSTRVLGDRPAYLARVDVHSAIASTALRRTVPGSGGRRRASTTQRPLTADAHHLVRAAARALLTAAAAARGPHRRARPGRQVRHRRGARVRGTRDRRPSTTGVSCDALAHGVEVVGYWGEAVRTADAGPRADRRRPARAGWPAICSSTARSARTRRGCTGPTPTRPDCVRQRLPRCRRHRGAPRCVHRGGDHRGLPRHRRCRRHVGGRRAGAGGRPPRRPGGGALRPPARAPRDGLRGAGASCSAPGA